MLQIMKKYTAEKVYYRQRRFREKWEDVSEEIQEKGLGLLKSLEGRYSRSKSTQG